jgi:magnesium-transporting ATPase (P-type)
MLLIQKKRLLIISVLIILLSYLDILNINIIELIVGSIIVSFIQQNKNIFNFEKIIIFTITQFIILFLLNIFCKKIIIHKYPQYIVLCKSILGSNIIVWFPFTLNIISLLVSCEPRNLLGFFIIGCQIYYNPNNPSKQFRSIPNQLFSLLFEISDMMMNEYKLYLKEKEINYKKITLINNKQIYAYELKCYDKIIVSENTYLPEDGIPISIDNDNKIKFIPYKTKQLDGESNIKLAKIQVEDIINQKNYNGPFRVSTSIDDPFRVSTSIDDPFRASTSIDDHIIKKNSEILANCYFIIIKSNNTINNNNIINNNFDKNIKQISLMFIKITILLTSICSIINYKNITYENINSYFLNIQMINPMAITTILIFSFNNFNKIKNISIIGLKRSFDFISKYLINKKNNKSNIYGIMLTDKTGTITKNKLKIIDVHVNNNFKSLEFQRNALSLLSSYIISSNNKIINGEEEEEALFNYYKINFINCYEENSITFKKTNYIESNILDLGFIKSIKAHIIIVMDKSVQTECYMLALANTDFLKENNVIGVNENIYDEIFNLIPKDIIGAPRFWTISKTKNKILSMNEYNKIINDLEGSKKSKDKNNNINTETIYKYCSNIFDNFEYCFTPVMIDEIKDNVNTSVIMNHKRKIRNIMITGDNLQTAQKISSIIKFKDTLYLSQIDQNNIIYDKTNFEVKNKIGEKDIVCYCVTDEFKGKLVQKFEEIDDAPTLMFGDGHNDKIALNNANFSVGFVDNKGYIDPNISNVSGLVVENDFWTIYSSEIFWENLISLNNIITKCIILLIIKQCYPAGIIMGVMYNSDFTYLVDPFSIKSYSVYQILAFGLVASPSLFTKYFKNFNKNIINLTIKLILLTFIISYIGGFLIYSLLTYYYGNDIEQNATFTLNIIYPVLLYIIIY